MGLFVPAGEFHPLQFQNASSNYISVHYNIGGDDKDDDDKSASQRLVVGGRLFPGNVVKKSSKKFANNPLVPTIVGILSWGLGCARPAYSGVFTDLRPHRTWILDQLYMANL